MQNPNMMSASDMRAILKATNVHKTGMDKYDMQQALRPMYEVYLTEEAVRQAQATALKQREAELEAAQAHVDEVKYRVLYDSMVNVMNRSIEEAKITVNRFIEACKKDGIVSTVRRKLDDATLAEAKIGEYTELVKFYERPDLTYNKRMEIVREMYDCNIRNLCRIDHSDNAETRQRRLCTQVQTKALNTVLTLTASGKIAEQFVWLFDSNY